MITVLIVDDEKNIRAGIHKILNESIVKEINYLEARNGIEALELIEQERPDLLITDIRMPKMDGLELMRQASLMENRPEIIVLSGFDEFSYAKEAISHGVVSYILKPVDRNELISVVSGAIEVIEKKRKTTVEQSVQRILSEGRMTRSASAGRDAFEPPFYFVMISGTASLERIKQLTDLSSCYILEEKSNSVCMLVHEDQKQILETSSCCEGMKIAFSGICGSLANLRTAWRQAVVASLSFFFRADASIYYYSENPVPFDRTAFDSDIQKLSSLIGSGDPQVIGSALDELFDFGALPEDDRIRYLYNLQEFIVTGIIKKYWEYNDADMYLTLKSIMIETIYQFKTISEYQKAVSDYILYLDSVLKKNHKEHAFIFDALEFIKNHFTEDINMTVVANQVSVNYTYFSEKFKEHTGCNFNEYLKKMRIEEAKRLLEKGCYKVYEVGTNSGFGDVKYFMKTFKESTGFSPGEYRKKF